MKKVLSLLLLLCLIACKKTNPTLVFSGDQETLINPAGKTIKSRFKTPKGFTRQDPREKSFQAFLQNFELKPASAKVHLFNGELKFRQDVHAGVLNISVGKRDLQQCADATMRLRAEYFYQESYFDSIRFNFTNGFDATYQQWRQGKRIKVKGNSVTWYNSTEASVSRASFNNYLTMVFSYAGTLSLAQEMKSVLIENLQIGDVFIQGGSPGHAVIVVDMAKNDVGETLFLLAQSYMPAQEIHVLKNFNASNISPWYTVSNLNFLYTPEWTFRPGDLKRFQ